MQRRQPIAYPVALHSQQSHVCASPELMRFLSIPSSSSSLPKRLGPAGPRNLLTPVRVLCCVTPLGVYTCIAKTTEGESACHSHAQSLCISAAAPKLPLTEHST